MSESEAAQPGRRGWLPFRRRDVPLPERSARGDMLIVAGGLALAIGSAMLPWYVFFNQDQFGIRALKFEGREDELPLPSSLALGSGRLRPPISLEEVPVMNLDFLATGTLPPEEDPPVGAVPLSQQPFPGEDRPVSPYRLVHVANGRAMLEDDNGLWVVQPGSLLPDRSRVASIERRGDGWVIVTDQDTVITIAD